MITNYWNQIRSINYNSKLYFTHGLFFGISSGISGLLFNYYLLSLEYNQAFIGSLVSIFSLSALLFSFPASLIISRIPLKHALLISFSMFSGSALCYILFPSPFVLYSMNIISGMANSMFMVSARPFLFDNTTEENRPYLFSLDWTIFNISSIIGNYGGGILPSYFAGIFNTTITAAIAYKYSLLVSVFILVIGLVPIFFLKRPKIINADDPIKIKDIIREAPIYSKLVTPTLIVSIGAGLLMPFLNIFYRIDFGQSDFVIGRMMAFGSLAMGIGLFLSPVFASRIGKLKLVIITQSLSIPFLFIMGFTSNFGISAMSYYIRMCLMNMSMPIYDVLLLEYIDDRKRTIFAGLLNMGWQLGWAIGPFISGLIQEFSGFSIIFLLTSTLYSIATFLNWHILRNHKKSKNPPHYFSLK